MRRASATPAGFLRSTATLYFESLKKAKQPLRL